MKEFIFSHWKLICYCLILLFSFLFDFITFIIILFVNTFKKYDDVRRFILEALPELISQAEELYQEGYLKKSYVIDKINTLLKSEFPKVITGIYQSYIKSSIEDILSTPQKKGK